MPTTETAPSEIGQLARAIYAEKIRPQLTEADKGKYLTINVDTGEWLMDADEEKLMREAGARFAGHRRYGMRVGYRAVHSFRAGVNLELAEW